MDFKYKDITLTFVKEDLLDIGVLASVPAFNHFRPGEITATVTGEEKVKLTSLMQEIARSAYKVGNTTYQRNDALWYYDDVIIDNAVYKKVYPKVLTRKDGSNSAEVVLYFSTKEDIK
jgi:hypothetical protein